MSEKPQKLSVKNLITQFTFLKSQTKLDNKTDGIIETIHLPQFFLQINYKLSEEEITKIQKTLDPKNSGKINLTDLLQNLQNYIKTNGSKKELIEAFVTFDENRTGKISLFDFRLFMKKYSGVSDEELDSMVLDIFECKKLSQVDKDGVVDYLEFCEKLFAVKG